MNQHVTRWVFLVSGCLTACSGLKSNNTIVTTCPNGLAQVNGVCPTLCSVTSDCAALGSTYICQDNTCVVNDSTQEIPAAPVITSVTGTGTPDGAPGHATRHITDAIVINGSALTSALHVGLVGVSSDTTNYPNLTIQSTASNGTSITVGLPTGLVAGPYRLDVTDDYGRRVSALVTFAAGAAGSTPYANVSALTQIVVQSVNAGVSSTNKTTIEPKVRGASSSTAISGVSANGFLVYVIDRTAAPHARQTTPFTANNHNNAIFTIDEMDTLATNLSEGSIISAGKNSSDYLVVIASQGDVSALGQNAGANLRTVLRNMGGPAFLFDNDHAATAISSTTSLIFAGRYGLGAGNASVVLNQSGSARGTILVIDQEMLGMQKVADLTILSADLLPGSVDTGAIAAGAVTNTKLADNSVGSDQIQADAVDSTKLKPDAVTVNELQSNAVTADDILNGQVADVDIANNAITPAKLVGPITLYSRFMSIDWLLTSCSGTTCANAIFLEPPGSSTAVTRGGWTTSTATTDAANSTSGKKITFTPDTTPGADANAITTGSRRLFSVANIVPSGVLTATDTYTVRIHVEYDDPSATNAPPHPRIGIFDNKSPRTFLYLWRSGLNGTPNNEANGPGGITGKAESRTLTDADGSSALFTDYDTIGSLEDLSSFGSFSTTSALASSSATASGNPTLRLGGGGFDITIRVEPVTGQTYSKVRMRLMASGNVVLSQTADIYSLLNPAQGLNFGVFGSSLSIATYDTASSQTYTFYSFDVSVTRDGVTGTP